MFFFFFFFPFSRQRTLVISILRRFPSLRRLPPMSFFQRVVHHLVNEVLVSGLANRCGFWKSLRRRAVFLFFFGVVVQIRLHSFQRSLFPLLLFSEVFGSGMPRRNERHIPVTRFEERCVPFYGDARAF